MFNGAPGHEIVLVYDGTFKEPDLYNQPVILGKEANGKDIRAAWMSLDEFGEGRSILYPTGLIEMLAGHSR
jgi:hypothetical protein